MRVRQHRRPEIVSRAPSGGMSIEQAAVLLGVMARQVRRLLVCWKSVHC